MTVPEQYATTGESAIASYNFNDISAGTGIVRFYAGHISGAGMILSNNQFYAQPIDSRQYLSSAAYPVIADYIAFSTTFNLPRIMKGDCIISTPLEMSGTPTALTKGNIHWNLYKLSGNQLTFLISGASGFVEALSGQRKEELSSVSIKIPATHFKKDDKFIISGVFLIGNGGDVGGSFWAADPKNRAGATITAIDTNLIIDVPFRIDI